jgi:hypothetical protein
MLRVLLGITVLFAILLAGRLTAFFLRSASRRRGRV